MIGVGINENVMLKSVTVNDKKRLVIELAPAVAETERNLFDESLTAGIKDEGSRVTSLNIFPPLVSKKTDWTEAQKVQAMFDDLIRFENQLFLMCSQFMTLDQIDFGKAEVKYANTSVNRDNFNQLLQDQDTVNTIYDNIARRFVELITPFVNNPEFAVRFKLIRQSKDKHYATIPNRYVKDNPFIELMLVPKDQSKVKFSDYEKSQGLDNSTPATATENKSAGTAADAAAAPSSNPFAE